MLNGQITTQGALPALAAAPTASVAAINMSDSTKRKAEMSLLETSIATQLEESEDAHQLARDGMDGDW